MKFALVELGEPLTAEEQEEKEKLLEEVSNPLAFYHDYMFSYSATFMMRFAVRK